MPQIVIGGTGEVRASTVGQLGDALAQHGFVSVQHPAVDQALLDSAAEQARRLFDLPVERKRSLTNHSPGIQPRGHAVFGAQRALAGQPGEFKEAWHVGPEPSAGRGLALNIWPAELAGLQQVARQVFAALNTVGACVLSGVERYLGLPRESLTDMVEGGPGLLRMLSYPRLRAAPERIAIVRTASHTDSCMITVMGNPSRPGLEIQSTDGSWLAVPQRPGSVVCNVGDILEIVSEGTLRSAAHRVSTRGEYNSERLAMPLFLIPRHDCQLQLPRQDQAAESISVGAYLERRLAELPNY